MTAPTREQIRKLVESLPDAAEAVASGREGDAEKLLNDPTLPGWVPVRHAVTTLASAGKWGLVDLAVRHRLLPGPGGTLVECSLAVYSLFATLMLGAYGTIEPPIRLAIEPLVAAADSLVAAGLMTLEERAAVLAGEVKISAAESAFGYGVGVSWEQIVDAMKGA